MAKYLVNQKYINNTNIMRSFHVAVRDFDTVKVISDKFGPGHGPFEDSRKEPGEMIWYRPSEHMNPKYIDGEEHRADYVMKRTYHYNDHTAVEEEKRQHYFAKVKKSNYLPKCIRDIFPTEDFNEHHIIRCTWDEQSPVEPDFYEKLGIPMGKDYLFEFQNVW